MCGIIGGFWLNFEEQIKIKLNEGLSVLAHRGPNDRGHQIETTNYGTVALGHTRLSIIDLTPAGHQPMVSKDGRYRIVFNGEIYNYRELREELRRLGRHFHSDSDTEVLLEAWIVWGESCLPRLLGMFAFVVYDHHKNTLTCVRDAFGIKPFFYSWSQGQFLFASEQLALQRLKGGKPEIDWQRSYDYLVHGDYDSQQRTFFAGVKHLLPAHWMVLDLSKKELREPSIWWQPPLKETSKLSFDQATEAVRAQFLENIKLHLRSDVPLGSALSGGIDSSAIVCAMRHIEPNIPIHTFSYIPENSSLSEEKYVNLVNEHVSAIPHKVTFSSSQLIDDLVKLISTQGEPFGSTSIYAQYRVFKSVKEAGITVTLEGQGADELLAGYIGYPGQRLLSLLETGKFIRALSFSSEWSKYTGLSYEKSWMYLGRAALSNNAYKAARKILGRNFSPDWLECGLLKDMGVNLNETRYVLSSHAKGRRVVEVLGKSLQDRGLPALLRHSDRNSMHFSVESRVPFLTVKMAELLLGLPEEYLISQQAESKYIFRSAMRGIVPDVILDRKDKIGFATPEQAVLMQEASQLNDYLQNSEYPAFLQKNAVLKAFREVVNGRVKFSLQMWRWINFIIWHNVI